MQITFIGAGRVATHLATALMAQHQIVQVFSRNLDHAKALANQVNAQAINQSEQLNQQTDLVIVAVSDQSIPAVIQSIATYLPNSLIVHTSGSTSLDIFGQIHSRVGVFYPLQSLRKEMMALPDILLIFQIYHRCHNDDGMPKQIHFLRCQKSS